jgi:hypothetical protein
MSPRKRVDLSIPLWTPDRSSIRRLAPFLPSPGSVVFTLLMIGLLVWAQSAGALGALVPNQQTTSTSTIPYQGRLGDIGGNPLTGSYPMVFRLYDVASGGTPIWEESWAGSNSVAVNDGLFNVMLGSISPISQNVFISEDSLWLGISVGSDDEMNPRVQLGTVPFAIQALTVQSDSITSEKIVDGAVGTDDLTDGAVTSAKIQNAAVTTEKLDPTITFVPPDGSVTSEKLADNAVTSRKMQPIVQSVYLTNQQSTTSTSWQDVPGMTLAIPVDTNQNLMIWGQASLFQDGTDNYAAIRIVANGQELPTASTYGGGTPGGAWSFETTPVMGVFAATPGTVTVKMQYHSGASYGSLYIANRNLVVMSVGR